jgi:uncharacterized protein YjbJ (UPF0337 family)
MTGMTGANILSINPNSDRSNIMKSGMRDEAEGKWHKMKGKIKAIAGKVSGNPKMETEGANEEIAGKVQKKIGEIKKVVGK